MKYNHNSKKVYFICFINFFVIIFLPFKTLISQTDLNTLSHGHVTSEAYNLLKDENLKYQYSDMNYFFDLPDNPCCIEDFRPFAFGTIKAGSFIEDQKEIMYNYGFPCNISNELITSTHFWDADMGDDFEWNPYLSCSFKNAFTRANAYWSGHIDNNSSFLILSPPVFPFVMNRTLYINGHYMSVPCELTIKIRFNSSISDAYRDPNNILVDCYWYSGPEPFVSLVNPPQPIIPFLLSHTNPGTLNESKINFHMKKVFWEIIGRICHLIEDMGVPAHAHNDPHGKYFFIPDFDSYEGWIPFNYKRKTWVDAKNQGGSININACQYPLRTALYTINQLADRFPSDDVSGDDCYRINTNITDSSFIRVQLQPFYDKLLGFPISSFRNKPIPPGLMDTLLNNPYTYSIRMTAGFLDFAYNMFGLDTNYSPLISPLTQSNVLRPNSDTYITCNTIHGYPALTYHWSVLTNDPSISYNDLGNGRLKIHKNLNKSGSKEEMKFIQVYCYVSNNFGNSNQEIINVYQYFHQNACPYIYVYNNDRGWVSDNNILIKSKFSENIGEEITDKYILRETPTISNGIIKIKLAELGNDSTIINNVKLYSIDHNIGTILGVDENNNLVLFDSINVKSTNLALITDTAQKTEEVTKLIQYDNNYSTCVSGDSLYHLYTQYNKSDNHQLGIIINSEVDWNGSVGNICNFDNYSGELRLTSQSNYFSSNFTKRLETSNTIIPINENFGEDSFYDMNINWYSSFKTQYVSLTNLNYNEDYIKYECMMLEAYNNKNVNVIDKIINQDSLNSYISENSDIEISFIPPILNEENNSKRDYLLEINGNIIPILNSLKNNNIYKKNNINNKNKNEENKIFDNYPNPFNPVTKISYQILTPGLISIEIFDVVGRKIKTLVNEYKNYGNYIVEFDGQSLSSGVYFYVFKSGNVNIVKKMLFVK